MLKKLNIFIRKRLCSLLFFMLFTNVCVSQGNARYDIIFAADLDSIIALVKPEYKWMGTDGLMVSDKMKLKYRKPKGFSEVDGGECFDDNPRLWHTFRCVSHLLKSNDGEFLAFMEFPPIHTEEFETRINRLFPQRARNLVDKQHFWQMRAIIQKFYNDEIGESWRDSITVYSIEEARKKWNADSAFTFSFDLRPNDCYKDDFKYVKVLLIQKKGRGYFYVRSFYTDKAKKRINRYWRRLEKALRYED